MPFASSLPSAELSPDKYCLKENMPKENHLSPKNTNQGQHRNTTNLFGVRPEEHQYLMSKLQHQQNSVTKTKIHAFT